MKAKIYNEEGRLVACNEETILELLELNNYYVDPDPKDMKILRIEHGVEIEDYSPPGLPEEPRSCKPQAASHKLQATSFSHN